MAEFFPSSFQTVQPGPGTVVLGNNSMGPVNVDTSQIASQGYVDTTVASASAVVMESVVTSFDGRIGAVTLEASDVTMALGYAPAASGGNANNEFAVAPASGSMYATPLGQVEYLIEAASGTYALLNGSTTETFSVALAASGYEAPQWDQVLAGNNATWHSFNSTQRAINTTYTNSYGKPIQVSIIGTQTTIGDALQLLVDGNLICKFDECVANYHLTVSGIVPEGSTYEFQNAGGTGTPTNWWELY